MADLAGNSMQEKQDNAQLSKQESEHYPAVPCTHTVHIKNQFTVVSEATNNGLGGRG